MKILIIIPAYNEEKNIKKTVERINNLKLLKKYILDYVVINDGSSDNTLETCRKNKYNVIDLINNLGIGGAVQTGYKYAYFNKYDVAIQFDGDGQHDENYIINLLEQIEKGYDLVIGSRFISNISDFTSTRARKAGIKILSFFIKVFTGEKIYDTTSGFRAANKSVIKYFAFNYPSEYPEPSSTVDIIKLGLKIKEIPVNMYERAFGTSSISVYKSFYYMFSVCLSIIFSSLLKRGKK